MSDDLTKIRNIGIMAHIDAGKTTVTERVLYYSGKTYKMGEVHNGTAVMDYLPEEQARGITITAAATTLGWKDHTINLIDTPGHVDFTAEVERSLRVLDGAVMVLCAVGGVEAQSETVWRQADKYHVPRLCFVNKLDRVGADFDHVVSQAASMLHACPAVLQLPIGQASDFAGVIDLVCERALIFDSQKLGSAFKIIDIPDHMRAKAAQARHDLLEKVAEFDEELMHLYVHDDEIPVDLLQAAIRRATISCSIQPVLCGSALKYKGIQPLLDAVTMYLPAPMDLPPVEGFDPKHHDKKISRPPDPKAPFAALVFKIQADSHGDLYYIRVYSGSLTKGSRVYNPVRDKRELISRIWQMHAGQRLPLDRIQAGDICAIVGLRHSLTGDTLADSKSPLVLEQIEFPETVISMSVEPVTSADRSRLGEALATLSREDPTFTYRYDEQTSQTIMSGMGELHLQVLHRKLAEDLKVPVRVGSPLVAYRETITASAETEYRFVRQTGGRGQFAVVALRVEPYQHEHADQPVVFESKIKGGAISAPYIKAVEQGVMDARTSGPLAGFPVSDVKVTLLDGREHEVDSSELAFEMAGSGAFTEALTKAKPALLEPIMTLQVVVPDSYFGPVQSDLSSRRAVITHTEISRNIRIIDAEVPLSRMFGYATAVRGLTQGRATYTMQPLAYRLMPEALAREALKT
ncbi:MAG: elongation factor G [Actinobacteria bacterium]|nr:elongation factor G [Actinomycetota bacterium]